MKLEKLTLTELRGYAEDCGIQLPFRLKSKDQIIEFIKRRQSDPAFIEELKRRKAFRGII
jgi:hypothetical protein